jgi:FKBP-type peptidyl-prolyl cis-trans isomerase
MSKYTCAAGLLMATFLTMATAQETKLETEADKVSYLIGRNIGGSIKADDLNLNVDILVASLREAIEGKESQISDADAQVIMTTFQETMQKKAEAKAAEASKENAAAGTKFLEENKKREGVIVTKSGLQYEVMKAAEGAKPKDTDTVSVHYHGTLLDGTVFDSSVDRGTPAEFPVNGVISGWTEALQLMPIGSKWKLFIPADLAYGDRGAPNSPIGPGTMLTFEVELLEVKAP